MSQTTHFSPPHKVAPLSAHSNFGSPISSAARQQLNFNSNTSSSSPFIAPAPNTNTKFNPILKVANKPSSATIDFPAVAPLKPPKAPEKPLTPYMRYSRKVWDKVRTSNPDSKLWDIGKVVGSMWRELSENAKQVYFDEYEADKVEYDKALKTYKHSPAYLTYEQQLQRNKAKAEKANRTPNATESGVYIQPVDEEDTEETNSVAQIASARFQRNQKLVMEIFSSNSVPDLRSIVNINKVMHVRRQIRSLASHQKTLENELELSEVVFQAKKRSLEESSKNFTAKWRKLSEEAKVIDEQQFDEMVTKHEQMMLKAYTDFKSKQQAEESSTQGFKNDQMMCEVRVIVNSIVEQVVQHFDQVGHTVSESLPGQ